MISGFDYEPDQFFATYPRFLESSETGRWDDRLNARFRTLIYENRELFSGARVLDLASHDGRFSFAALACGAREVVGIESLPHLVSVAQEHFDVYGVDPERYEFVVGDIYDSIPRLGQFDLVLCLGIFYHVCDHMALLDLIAGTEPRSVLLDSHVSSLPGCVVQFHDPTNPLQPPEPGAQIEGYPSPMAIEAMVTSFGWDTTFIDWSSTGLVDLVGMKDYRTGRRVSALVTCPEHEIPVAVRDEAVADVLKGWASGGKRNVVAHLVARKHGIRPQALRRWARRAERNQSVRAVST